MLLCVLAQQYSVGSRCWQPCWRTTCRVLELTTRQLLAQPQHQTHAVQTHSACLLQQQQQQPLAPSCGQPAVKHMLCADGALSFPLHAHVLICRVSRKRTDCRIKEAYKLGKTLGAGGACLNGGGGACRGAAWRGSSLCVLQECRCAGMIAQRITACRAICARAKQQSAGQQHGMFPLLS